MEGSNSASQSLVSAITADSQDDWESNVEAVSQLAETLGSTLGPKGLDKLIVTSDGKLIISNDGASVLERLDVEHPAATLVADVAKQQEAKAGDGTTTAILLAGALLSEARSLTELGLHPTTITEGFQIGAAMARDRLADHTVSIDVQDDEQLADVARTVVTGKWDERGREFLADRAVSAVRAVQQDDRLGFEKITRKTVAGGSFTDSEVIDGLVIDMEESPADVLTPDERRPATFEDATVALIDEEVSVDKPTGMGALSPESYGDVEALRDYEDSTLQAFVDQIEAAGTDVVFSQQSIDTHVVYRLAAEGILAVERVRRDEMHKLARATGAEPVLTRELSPTTTGTAASVELRQMGGTDVTVVSGATSADHVTLLFRGGTDHVLEETKRKVDDCLHVLKLAIEDQQLLPGGGAVEVALAQQLRADAPAHDGREQLAIESFASALEVVPHTLATSAGMDPVGALVELRSAQSDGETAAGLDLTAKTVADVASLGVVEPLHVKRQAITSATDAATMIVRIDDTLAASGGEDHGHDHEDHDHGPGGLEHSTEGYPWAVGHSMGHDH